MAFQVIDATGEATSVYLHKSGVVPVGKPLRNVAIEPLKEELKGIYGTRFRVENVTE